MDGWTEPPYLRDFSDDDIKKFLDKPLKLDVPSNTQHVERLIQLITTIGPKSASSTLRHGMAHATIRYLARLG